MLSNIVGFKKPLFLVASLGLALLTAFSFSQLVSAGPEDVEWVNNFTVTYDGRTFASNDNDSNWVFYEVTDDSCKDEIQDIKWRPSDGTSADDDTAIYIPKVNPAQGCPTAASGEVEVSVDPATFGNSSKSFVWDGGSIFTASNSPSREFIYRESTENGVTVASYLDDSQSVCQSSITTSVKSDNGTLVISRESSFNTTDDLKRVFDTGYSFWSEIRVDRDNSNDTCTLSEPISISIGDTDKSEEPGVPPQNERNNPVGGGGEVLDSCETLSGVGAEWWACGLLRGLDSVINTLDSGISGMLGVSESDYGSRDGDNNGYYRAWSGIKNFATIAIVFTAIFMVLSTALDMGLFSNYTVKKYLPRIVASVIGIQLSWVGLTFAIDIITQLGDGVESLMYLPFEGARGFRVSDIFGSSNASAAGFTALFAGGAGVGVMAVVFGSLTVYGVLGFALQLVAALFWAFIFLIFRKIAIVTLLVLSPLAIAAWVLPGNDNVWNLWRRTFFGLLFMYPAILVAIGAGKIFAFLAVEQDGGSAQNLTTWILAIVGYGAGYAAAPVLAKSFQGALGTLTGNMNDKSKGLFDRGKNRLNDLDGKRKEYNKGIKKERRATLAGQETGIKGKMARSSIRRDAGMRALGDSSPGGNLLRKVPGEIGARAQLEGDRTKQKMAQLNKEILESQQKDAEAEFGDYGETHDRKQFLDMLENKALTGSKAESLAAVKLLAQNKDFGRLDNIQEVLRGRAESGDTEAVNTWNQMMGANYSSLKELSPSLVTDIAPNKDGTSKTKEQMDAAKRKNFIDTSDEGLSQMSGDAWKQFTSVDAAGSSKAAKRVMSNEKLKGGATRETVDYMDLLSGPQFDEFLNSEVGVDGPTSVIPPRPIYGPPKPAAPPKDPRTPTPPPTAPKDPRNP